MRARLKGSRAWTALAIVLARVVGAALGLVVSLFMARTMPADQMGIALTAMSVATLLPIVASGSAEIGATRFLTQALAAGETSRAAGFVSFTWRVTLVCVPLVIATGAWLAPALAPAGHGRVFLLAVLAAAVLGLVRVGAAHASGFSRVVLATVPNSLFRPALLLALLALVVRASPAQPGAVAVLGCFLAAAIGVLVIQQLVLARSYSLLRGVRPNRAGFRRWLAYGLQMGAAMMFIEYSKEITTLLAAVALPSAEVAKLSVALSFIGFARFGLVAINQSVVPDLSRAIGADDMGRLVHLVDRSNLAKLAISCLSLVGFSVFADDLMRLYSPGFVAAAPVLLVLMWDPVLMTVLGPSQNVLSLTGHHRILVDTSLLIIPVLAGLVIVGSWLGGMVGCALGATISWALYFGVLAWRLNRRMGLDLTLVGTVRRRLRRG